MGERDPDDDYSKYYQSQLKDADEFADFVVDRLLEQGLVVLLYRSKKNQYDRGESRAGVEIKLDKEFVKTGNLFIETAEKSHPDNPEFVPSGIRRGDNSFLYAIGNCDEFFVFGIRTLQMLHDKSEAGDKRFKLVENRTHTALGYLLPRAHARHWAQKTFYGNVKRMTLPGDVRTG